MFGYKYVFMTMRRELVHPSCMSVQSMMIELAIYQRKQILHRSLLLNTASPAITLSMNMTVDADTLKLFHCRTAMDIIRNLDFLSPAFVQHFGSYSFVACFVCKILLLLAELIYQNRN